MNNIMFCFESLIDGNNLTKTCMLQQNHSGKHKFVPDRLISISYLKSIKPLVVPLEVVVIKQSLSEDPWI